MFSSPLAAVDISAVQSAVQEIAADLAVVLGAGLGLAVIFMAYKLVRRSIAEIDGSWMNDGSEWQGGDDDDGDDGNPEWIAEDEGIDYLATRSDIEDSAEDEADAFAYINSQCRECGSFIEEDEPFCWDCMEADRMRNH